MDTKTYLAGVSVGLLPAFAIAVAPSVTSLISFAIDAIAVAFRLGLHIHQTAAHLSSASRIKQASCWSREIRDHESNIQRLLDGDQEVGFPRNTALLQTFAADLMCLRESPNLAKSTSALLVVEV